MESESPIVTCKYGWGHLFSLYAHHLDADHTHYPLIELIDVRSVYRDVIGIPSARLELHFGKKKLVLAGIADIEDARKAEAYLMMQIEANLAASTDRATATVAPRFIVGESIQHVDDPAWVAPARQMEELAQAITAKVEIPDGQDMHAHKITCPIESVTRDTITNPARGRGITCPPGRVPYPYHDTLPEVSVPIHMLPGERAHYIADATLCGERSSQSTRSAYPTLDQGMLILTSKRVIYIGRKSQVILDYACLLHVSPLHGAIAMQGDHWQKRRIFALRRALECATYLEYILKRFEQDNLTEASPVTTLV